MTSVTPAITRRSTRTSLRFEVVRRWIEGCENAPRNVRGAFGAEGRDRTADTTIFSRMLYLLSYLGACPRPDGVRAGGR